MSTTTIGALQPLHAFFNQKVFACYCIFDEGSTLDASLFSIINLVDGVIVVDAPFTSNPTTLIKSPDNTYKILNYWQKLYTSLGKPFIVINPKNKLMQSEARTLLVQEAGYKNAIAFVIDGDELAFIGNPNLINLNQNVWFTKVLSRGGAQAWRPRFFRVNENVEYTNWFTIKLANNKWLNLKDLYIPSTETDVLPPVEQQFNYLRLVNLFNYRGVDREAMALATKKQLMANNWVG